MKVATVRANAAVSPLLRSSVTIMLVLSMLATDRADRTTGAKEASLGAPTQGRVRKRSLI
jgi:hypothetical protein